MFGKHDESVLGKRNAASYDSQVNAAGMLNSAATTASSAFLAVISAHHGVASILVSVNQEKVGGPRGTSRRDRPVSARVARSSKFQSLEAEGGRRRSAKATVAEMRFRCEFMKLDVKLPQSGWQGLVRATVDALF